MHDARQSSGIFIGLFLLGLTVGIPSAFAAEGDAARAEYFEKFVRPLLSENCYECHGPRKQKSGLRLDHISTILKGGERGPELVPGHPERSRIIEAVGYSNVDFQMPPRRKLSDEKVAILSRWIEQGAYWPDEPAPSPAVVSSEQPNFDLRQRAGEHWSWRGLSRIAPPNVKRKDWPIHPLDRYVLAKLESQNLTPAPPTDSLTLIRRVYFDLIGLPPTPEEIDAFINDRSKDAYEKLVDRLLASPRFGERWARHWLDLMRYAESYGHEFDYAIADPWRYRDYVIRALNDDVPYDRFVLEHLAGDLIDDPRMNPEDHANESIRATAFWFLYEQVHAPTDARQHEVDRIDNQIDVMSKTFLGLTVACARCHDHKFDAISTKDYYALAGMMRSTREQMAYLDPEGKIAAAAKQIQPVVAQAHAALAALRAETPGPTTFDHDASVLYEDFNGGSFDGWRATGEAWGEMPTQPGQWDAAAGGARFVLPGVAHSGMLSKKFQGTLRSPQFDVTHPVIAMRVMGKGKINVMVDSFTMARFNALLFKGLEVNVDTKGKWQWVTIGGDLKLYAGKSEHRACLQFIDDDEGAFLAVDEVRFTTGPVPRQDDSPAAMPSISAENDERFAPFASRIDEIEKTIPRPMRVMAATDSPGDDSYVHIRGSWKTPGETVPRRILTALGGEKDPPIESGSGRLEIARRILDVKRNPAVARVQVNRIWHHLMGRGIVPSVDNFGVLGEPPSHPELLDHLAERWIEEGWSVKKMIRLIVTSQTYRMSSDASNLAAERLDPANVLLHRMNIKRLEGEAIRDAILAISGRLNLKMYGPPVLIHLTPFMEGRGRPGSGPLDGEGRRSVYLSVRRNFLSPMFLAFDTPTPFSTVGKRSVSNVPAQSLILMNDPFVVEQAKRWAEQVTKETPGASVEQRIDRMHRQAFARGADPAQIAAAKAFLASQSELYGKKIEPNQNIDPRAWADLAHALLIVKSFILVN